MGSISRMRSLKQGVTIAQKEFLARQASRLFPVYLVNEYPKCGGTWLKYMLADAMNLPNWRKTNLCWSSCVMQAHWMNPRGKCKTVALFRDGRDVMVSYYYHSFFRNEHGNAKYTEEMRDRFQFQDFDNIRENLLPFMKVVLGSPISPAFSWIDFVRKWHNYKGAIQCHYEELRQDTPATLQRLVRSLTGEELDLEQAEKTANFFSIEAMRNRQAPENLAATGASKQISFIRRGVVGGWVDHFTDEAEEWFWQTAGPEMTKLGYPRYPIGRHE